MGTGKDTRDRRVVYQWSFKRYQHDNRAINKMIERAEAVADGTRPLKKDRFVKFTGTATRRRLGPGRAGPLPRRPQGLCRRRGYAEVRRVVAGDARGRGWLVGIITGSGAR